jgi:hypothetical protein
MARPRSAVYAVEGESRRPGIHLDWVTGQRHRHHLHETVLQRALKHATVWQGGLPKRASPTPSAIMPGPGLCRVGPMPRSFPYLNDQSEG